MEKRLKKFVELPFSKNDTVEADIADFGLEGEGIAKIDGVPLFIRGAVPGERVRAKVIGTKTTMGFGLLEKVLTASPDRIEPPCPYYPKCGGCTLQHIVYARQTEFKRAHIFNTVRKIAGIDLPLDAVCPSNAEYRCRNKLSLPVRKGKDGETLIGFFRRNSHDVVDMDDCLMQKESCLGLIAALKAYMDEKRLSAYSDTKKTGEIRHITLRDLGGVKTVTLVGTHKDPSFIGAFAYKLRELYGENYALWYNCNPLDTNIIYGAEFTHVAGKNNPADVDGLKMRIHPAGFFQVNDAVREKLYAYVTDKAKAFVKERGGKAEAVEAYAGAGVLAAKLAAFFKRVTAIEISAKSVAAGEEIKELNGIKNLDFIEGDCAVELRRELTRLTAGNNAAPIFAVLDPPRQGVDPAVTAALNACAPDRVCYISCNPATLARDLGLLKDRYTVDSAAAFDMFPQTPDVETVVCLSRKD